MKTSQGQDQASWSATALKGTKSFSVISVRSTAAAAVAGPLAFDKAVSAAEILIRREARADRLGLSDQIELSAFKQA